MTLALSSIGQLGSWPYDEARSVIVGILWASTRQLLQHPSQAALLGACSGNAAKLYMSALGSPLHASSWHSSCSAALVVRVSKVRSIEVQQHSKGPGIVVYLKSGCSCWMNLARSLVRVGLTATVKRQARSGGCFGLT